MCIHLNFDYKKSTQAVVYFTEKEGGHINKMKALKMVYFADRYHLRKYARPITNDEYFAMPYGPVASGVKDIIELSGFMGEMERNYANQFITTSDSYEIAILKAFEPDVFSKTDIESLDFVWKKFGQYDEFELSKISHQYPEWKKHENSLQTISRVKMNLDDFLEDSSDPSVEQCFSLSDKEKQDTLNELKELAKIEALWN